MFEIPSQLSRWKKKVDKLNQSWNYTKTQIKEIKGEIDDTENKIDDVSDALNIAQIISKEIQQKVHSKIAGVVSRCLTSVFENPYELEILFEQKRGGTEASLVFTREGNIYDKPMKAGGGGPVDVAAFALRLSCMMLATPKLRSIVFLDEPFKSPSTHYREKIRELLEILSDKMKTQIIMTTNIEELEAGKIIDIS